MVTAQEKPFDAVAGETLQASVGHCQVYMEQIVHEPQITVFEVGDL